MLDVLVVGAGPVGLTLAAELARYGLSVRIVDKAAHPTTTSKALAIWSRSLELFDRMGCTEQFLAAGIQGHGASIRSGGQVLGHARLDAIPSAYNFALMIPQRETERLMAAHLGRFGPAVEREVELTGFEDRGDRVQARLHHADGREEMVDCLWLVGCDGAHSTVRHSLGFAFAGAPEPNDWVLADVTLQGAAAPPADEVSLYLHRDGLFVVFPMPGPRFRLVATLGAADPDKSRPDPTLESIQTLIGQRAGGGFTAEDPQWLANFRVHERKVADYRRGRVFLAGDAAHIHSPAGGQGMNTGMQDAINLAWKLAMVGHGAADPDLLLSYSPERSAVGEIVLRNATRMTEMATLANPAAQGLRNLVLRFALGLAPIRERMALQMSEVEIAYGSSPLSRGLHAGAHGLVAGGRLPPEFYAGAPPGAGERPRFVLYAEPGADSADLLSRFPEMLEPVARPAPEGGLLLLVRPDGYIGFAGKAGDWAEAIAYLGGLAA
jgi:2-polyprenyl-6-methoxyphenol hydroxylase-like FAD-dependent oxidoreductase